MGKEEDKARFLLVSDIDDTLLGDDDGLEAFKRHYQSVSERTTLVYASGRFYETICEDIRQTGLPEPAAVISGVGSEIHPFPRGERFEDWTEAISTDWSAEKVSAVLDGMSSLERQPEAYQSAWKASYFFTDADSEALRDISRKLERAGLKANIIYSSHRDLDILPGEADKGSAARWLAQKWSYPPGHVFTAGNSDNDRAMMGDGMKGIIVANADRELKEMARREDCYLASRGHGFGVVEGIRYWMERIDRNDE
jgi:sucrose-6F-phosphate phosphohydrolase